MNTLRGWLFDNLGLKLVALLMAVLVYLNVYTDRPNVMLVSFPLRLTGLADTLAVAGTVPSGVIGRGLQGEIEGRIGRTRGLRLGPFEFRNVITSFTTRQTGTTCSADGLPAEGNLGVEVLSRFRVVVDYPHQRLLLSPNSRYAKPFEYNMAGLSLEQQQDGSYLVRSVLAGSPGADAGITRGDRIVGIAGRDTGHYSYTEGSDRFRRNGRSLKVSVERNGERFERTLALRRLI